MVQVDWKLNPADIEAKSFAIIDGQAGDHHWDSVSWTLIRRLVHTSADFDYVKDVVISPDAIKSGVQAIKQGAVILTDTHMALSGINLKNPQEFGNKLICLIDDKRAVDEAKRTGMTRAMAAVDLAFSEVLNDGQKAVWVFGNAPTALFRLLERLSLEPSLPRPELIIGLPVGFVNALEAKQALAQSAVSSFITNSSRKGGSNVAAATVNALASLARKNVKI
ncbi:MAG: precorrin-8X methylmutase [Deltaproteobacteria bacterium]|jgi:precorrin-8X/cobalt-precorrin-8 methylmutase|nr:precorrin-8X methylmutase [Deltaproteobacteria bacterium]